MNIQQQQAIAKAQARMRMQQSQPVDFDFGTMVSNIPESGARYIGDIVNTITNPIDAGRAVLTMVRGLGDKIGRNAAEFVTGQEFEVDPDSDERFVNEIGKSIVKRYGSVDAFKTTLMNDPVGVLADIGGVLSGAGAISGSARVSSLARAIEPTGAATSAVRKVASKIPEGMYESAAKFSTTIPSGQRSAMARTALEYGIRPTAAGVEKLQGVIGKYNAKLDEIISGADYMGQRIPVSTVLRYIEGLKSERGGIRLNASGDVDQIDKIIDGFKDHLDSKGKGRLTPQEVQQFKIDTYQDINFDARHSTGTPVKEDVYKAAARGAKDTIEEILPEAGSVNQKLGPLYQLQPNLQRSANRIENRNLIGIDTPAKGTLGYAVGDVFGAPGAGVAAGTAASLLGRPQNKTALAIAAYQAGRPIGSVIDGFDSVNPRQARFLEALIGRLLEEQESDQ